MTYRSTSRAENFQNRTGSSSTRIFATGHGEGGDPVEILPTVKEQYEHWKSVARDVGRKLDKGDVPSVERAPLRERLAEALRHVGHLRQLLQEGHRMAFERIFSQVAHYRLPSNTFLKIVEEAREIWRSKGYADYVPPPTKRERRRAEKRALKLS